MRQVIAGFIASLLIAGLFAPAVASAAAPRSTGVAKVVIIVGPVGSTTDRFRAEARQTADVARKYTPDVTEIYSPNATWPAVRRALQGASLVIYMGHGNGWPSQYRDELYPPTQNGFGLNPSAGSGDDTHQYFGESKIAASIRLAPDAVVLLNHLCYASGNSEPGLAEGTLAMAKQRVDNFAAGFVKAGASAVVAEAYASPSHMVRSVLGGRGSIESAWRRAPTSNGHSFGFESTRSPGYVVEMDPEHSSYGFSRSIVLKAGLASADVLRGGRGNARGSSPVDATALVPSLVARGVALKTPAIAGGTAAGSRVYYRIPFTIADRTQLPDKVQASVRWDPLDPVAADPSAATGGTETTPDFGLIAPERVGDVVAPTGLTITRTRMSFHVAAPATPGRYRLTVTLHDGEGVAYDAATQAMVPTLVVRVTADNDAGVIAPSQIEASPGRAQRVSVWVANFGKSAWGRQPEPIKRSPDGALRQTNLDDATHARLVGTWIALGGFFDPAQQAAAAAASVSPVELPAGMAPRAVTKVELTTFAPTAPGDYLLVLDILTPGVGSLSAQGVDPTFVRVHVGAGSAASATPDPSASATSAPSPSAKPVPSPSATVAP